MADEIKFDWDSANADHLARHDVKTAEVEQVFANSPVFLDSQYENEEERHVVIGLTNADRFLTIVWTPRNEAVRPITGWDSTREEQAAYWVEKGM